MDINCDSLVADMFLYAHEACFLQWLLKKEELLKISTNLPLHR